MNNSNPPSDSPQQQAEEIIRLVRNSLQSIQQVNVAAAAFQPASSNSHEGTLGVNAQTGRPTNVKKRTSVTCSGARF